MENIRLFVALPLEPGIRGLLQTKLPGWQRRLPFHRWTHPADWHITLHFLGDTPHNGLPSIIRAMNDCASQAAPFRLCLSGPGTFGDPNRPSVIWIGLSKPMDPLLLLHQRLGDSLQAFAGFSPDPRPYRPHVTLARKYNGDGHFDPALLDPMKEELRGHPASWIVKDIVLYRSRLGHTPMYEAVERIPLCENDRD